MSKKLTKKEKNHLSDLLIHDSSRELAFTLLQNLDSELKIEILDMAIGKVKDDWITSTELALSLIELIK